MCPASLLPEEEGKDVVKVTVLLLCAAADGSDARSEEVPACCCCCAGPGCTAVGVPAAPTPLPALAEMAATDTVLLLPVCKRPCTTPSVLGLPRRPTRWDPGTYPMVPDSMREPCASKGIQAESMRSSLMGTNGRSWCAKDGSPPASLTVQVFTADERAVNRPVGCEAARRNGRAKSVTVA